MGKNRLASHIAAVLAILFFAFLAISSTASTPKTVTENEISSKTTSRGAVQNIEPDPAERPYETLGLVFATTVKKIDEKGKEVSDPESIVTVLLREAQKLGGNDIVNLRVDENVLVESASTTSGSSTKQVTTTTVTYTGSALAIKYRNDLPITSGSSIGAGLVPDKFTIEGSVEKKR
jgi:hypothetical protein